VVVVEDEVLVEAGHCVQDEGEIPEYPAVRPGLNFVFEFSVKIEN
jgi:hypothetical protein